MNITVQDSLKQVCFGNELDLDNHVPALSSLHGRSGMTIISLMRRRSEDQN